MSDHDVFPIATGEGPVYTGGFIVICKECGSRRMQMPYREDKPPVTIECGEMTGSIYRDTEAVMHCIDCGAVRLVRVQTHTLPNYCLKNWTFDLYGWHCPVPVGP